jgi:predicted GNAT family acetyltransferase
MNSITHDGNAMRFSTTVDGQLAVLDYTLSGSVMNIVHTGVPSAIGGRGIAAELMRAALAAAADAHWQVNPVCSYAAAYLRRHPDAVPKTPAAAHVDALLDEALDESFPASDPPSVGESN